jgi:hypothetical protein
MEFCLIAPISSLELDDGEYHLTLAQYMLKSEKYFKFYRKKIKEGHYVILDNGAAEQGASIDMKVLIKIVEKLRPNEVVAPDVLYNYRQTVRATTKFCQLIKDFDVDVMGVPQGQTSIEWWSCLQQIVDAVDCIGLSKYSVSKCFGKTARPTIAKVLEAMEMDKSIHLLGLVNGVHELLEYKGVDVRSVDSCLPVKYGKYGFRIWDDANTSLYFTLESRIPKKYYQLCRDNVAYVRELVKMVK